MIEDVNEILKRFQLKCMKDHYNKKHNILKDYNKIQCEIIKEAKMDIACWISLYGKKYSTLVHYEDTVEELMKDLYK